MFDSKGEWVHDIPTGKCWTVRVRQSDQTVWASTYENRVVKLDSEGGKLLSLEGFSDDQKYVAVSRD